MNLNREIDRAARSMARSNLERCLSCRLFGLKCREPMKEDLLTCNKFRQLSYRNQVVIVGLEEFSRSKGTRNRSTLLSFC